MATLTTSWQNVASYRFAPGTGFVATFYLDAKYSSQSQANNTTTIQTRLNCTVNQGSGGGNGYNFTLSYGSTKQGSGYWSFATETITTGSGTITHNADGKKSITLSSYLYVGYTGLNHTMSTTVTLPTIKRASKINSFIGNDVEGTFSATYTKYVSSWENRLRISIPGVQTLQTYNDYTSGTGVTLEDENIEYIKNYMNTNHVSTVTLGGVIETWNGNNKIGESSEIKNVCSFIDANPTMTYTTHENNQKVVDVLGNAKATTVIQNTSKMQITVSPTAKKGATISNVSINHNGTLKTLNQSPYVFEFDVQASDFIITVTDVRGLSTTKTLSAQMLPYKPVKINSYSFVRVNPTSDDIKVSLDSDYLQQTYNETPNTPVVQWMLENSNVGLFPANDLYPADDLYIENMYIDIPSEYYNISDGKLTINEYLLENVLDYKKQGKFYIRIKDLFSEASDTYTVIKGIPTMDMGEHDVCINGDLYIADENRNNKKSIKEYMQEVYSTTEVLTNKVWIDGSQIYRKVINFTTGSGNNYIILTDSNIDTIVDVNGFISYSNGYHKLGGYANSSYYSLFQWNESEKKLYIYYNGYSSQSGYCVIEYTKSS